MGRDHVLRRPHQRHHTERGVLCELEALAGRSHAPLRHRAQRHSLAIQPLLVHRQVLHREATRATKAPTTAATTAPRAEAAATAAKTTQQQRERTRKRRRRRRRRRGDCGRGRGHRVHVRLDHVLDNDRVVRHLSARPRLEVHTGLRVHAQGLGVPLALPQPQVGEVLHREADQVRHGHRHAAPHRRLHGQRTASAAPALRDHHAESERDGLGRQPGRLHLQGLSDDQPRDQAARLHPLLALLHGLRARRLPPLPAQSAVHLLPRDQSALSAAHALDRHHHAVLVVLVPHSAARPLHGALRQHFPFLVLHDHVRPLAGHVLLDTALEDQLLHHLAGGVQRARGDIREVLRLRLLLHLHIRLLQPEGGPHPLALSHLLHRLLLGERALLRLLLPLLQRAELLVQARHARHCRARLLAGRRLPVRLLPPLSPVARHTRVRAQEGQIPLHPQGDAQQDAVDLDRWRRRPRCQPATTTTTATVTSKATNASFQDGAHHFCAHGGRRGEPVRSRQQRRRR